MGSPVICPSGGTHAISRRTRGDTQMGGGLGWGEGDTPVRQMGYLLDSQALPEAHRVTIKSHLGRKYGLLG